MRNKVLFLFAIISSFLVCTSTVTAEEEQWLQYCWSRDARNTVRDMSMRPLELSEIKPQGAELPAFKSAKPLFVKWLTPMAKGGSVLIGLDKSNNAVSYNILYIDSNGDGNLSDEKPIATYQIDQYQTRFEPAQLIFEGEDGPITYHLNLMFYHYDKNNLRMYAESGCWYEGTVMVGDIKKHCVLIDQNVNGVFNDQSNDFGQSDRIKIDTKPDREASFVGNYIEVDGKLYNPEVARDGAYIKLTPAENVVFGSVKIPETISEFAAGGENGLLYVKLEKGEGKLPVGKYRIHHWQIEKKDEKNNNWKLKGRSVGNSGIFDITENEVVSLNVGEPVVSSLQVTQQGRTGEYYFNQSLKGQLGEYIEITCNQNRPREPKLLVKNTDGIYNRSFNFAYG